MRIDLDKHWWVVNVAAGVVGLIVLMLADAFFPTLESYAMYFFLILVGLSFLWLFVTRAEQAPWAIAPAVGCFTFVVVGLVNQMTGAETFGWVGSLIVGLGAAIIAAVPNPRIEIKVAYVVSLWFLVPGFLLSPLPLALRIILAAASVVAVAYLLWQNREAFRPT